jgi:hypothetical protein
MYHPTTGTESINHHTHSQAQQKCFYVYYTVEKKTLS